MLDEHLFVESYGFLSDLYKKYLKNPQSVGRDWHIFFSRMNRDSMTEDPSYDAIKHCNYSCANSEDAFVKPQNVGRSSTLARFAKQYIASVYRDLGFCYAKLDPLKEEYDSLDRGKFFGDRDALDFVDFGKEDGYDDFNETATQLMDRLERIYCGRLSLEHCNASETKKEWLFAAMEGEWVCQREKQIQIAAFLRRVKEFEQFLHSNFLGAKRFSGEGLECLVLAIEEIVLCASQASLADIVIGMAHRGRIATLREVLGKDLESIFMEFGVYAPFPLFGSVSGDVKYHNGFSGVRTFDHGKINLCVLNSPSHLESVDGVLMGSVRARQDALPSANKQSALGILVHGDAAVAGQGVAAESMAMSGLEAYDTMGIIHIIANNQLGFTASIGETRLRAQPSGFAYFSNAPVIHVNADYPEHVARAAGIAFAYRMLFKSDIVINIIGYRKYGHNESDEPRFTQPLMYKIIDAKQSVSDSYSEGLIEQGILLASDMDEQSSAYNKAMTEALHVSKSNGNAKKLAPFNQWGDFIVTADSAITKTGVDESVLADILLQGSRLPGGFRCLKQAGRFLEERRNAAELGVHWSNAEFLAFATLLIDGFSVRLAGEDACRGTFSQRHAVILDTVSEQRYVPLRNINNARAVFSAYNTLLSEYAAMAFEYGYSIWARNTLVLWEAQFGDFANVGQVIIDQYIAAAEAKWLQSSGLTLLLPHGYEGQGPEHSSARIERFLQLCANNNMQIINCSTPANYFHALRRQMLNKLRKPLVIFSVKSLLRHKLALSQLSEMGAGSSFRPVIASGSDQAEKVVFCSGKIYYDLLEKITDNIKVIRIEQLYPFPANDIDIVSCRKAGVFLWVQEEPENMGVWFFVRDYLNDLLKKFAIDKQVEYIGRPPMSSPASGYAASHVKMQELIINKILSR